VESSAAATLLRFQAPVLLGLMATEHGLHFTGLLIRNLIPAISEAAECKPPSTTSQVSAHLAEASEACACDEIRASLSRLARTLDKQAKSGSHRR
jgi:hypothetical protein